MAGTIADAGHIRYRHAYHEGAGATEHKDCDHKLCIARDKPNENSDCQHCGRIALRGPVYEALCRRLGVLGLFHTLDDLPECGILAGLLGRGLKRAIAENGAGKDRTSCLLCHQYGRPCDAQLVHGLRAGKGPSVGRNHAARRIWTTSPGSTSAMPQFGHTRDREMGSTMRVAATRRAGITVRTVTIQEKTQQKSLFARRQASPMLSACS